MIGRAGMLAGTMGRLGIGNVMRVATYRALLKAGVYRRLLPVQPPQHGPFFDWTRQEVAPSLPAQIDAAAWEADAQRVMNGELPVFSDHWVTTGFPPRWQRSVLTGVDFDDPQRHWTDIPDFALPGGDVKGYWEPARFDGLLILTLGWVLTRRSDMALAIEDWLQSWAEHNPANVGIQWKCGQEAGIRLMHLLLVAELLSRWGGVATTANLHTLVAQHCERISRTMLYAIGQDNNHGTSEAGALFAGGSFLSRHATTAESRRGRTWCRSGRGWLENRVARLVMADGSFSQHSVNYHRMMLDTCSFAETSRRWHGEATFSSTFMQRCALATEWLAAFTDNADGDAPNLGANDGARLFVMHRLPYRDFRPSVTWAACVFAAETGFGAGRWHEPLAWLGLSQPEHPAPISGASALFPQGGYAKLAAGNAWLVLRLPHYRFRPSQSDGLHLDLWVDGENLFRDGGSFSYNTTPQWLLYFGGVVSHCTVQFDGRDQMPRLSRFLFGRWLRCEELAFHADEGRVVASYRDHLGATHQREVQLTPGRCVVTDTVWGFARSAVLRWRLMPSAWITTEQGVSNGTVKIEVLSQGSVSRRELVEGQESRHYARMTPLPVLEVEVTSPATLITELTW